MTSAQQVSYNSERVSEVIFRYASLIGAEQDHDKLLTLNADMARDLSGADRCSIWLLDEKAKQLWTKVAHGTHEIRVPAGEGLVGSCVKSGQTLVVNDVSSDERFFKKVDNNSGYQTKSVLVIPLRAANGKVIGALQMLNKPAGFSNADVEILG